MIMRVLFLHTGSHWRKGDGAQVSVEALGWVMQFRVKVILPIGGQGHRAIGCDLLSSVAPHTTLASSTSTALVTASRGCNGQCDLSIEQQQALLTQQGCRALSGCALV
jgi:hypothetical protein